MLVEEIWLFYDCFVLFVMFEFDVFGDLLYLLYEFYCGQIIVSVEEMFIVEVVNVMYVWLLCIQFGDLVMVIECVVCGYDWVLFEWWCLCGVVVYFWYYVDIW